MKQLSVQQQKEIDQSKANTIKEKEGNNLLIIDLYGTLYISSVLEKELMSERLRLKVTLTEKEGK